MKTVLMLGTTMAIAGAVACLAQTPRPADLIQSDVAASSSTKVTVDDSHARAIYANFSRVTGTPEELILDFGLNAQPFGVPKTPVVIDERIVMNYYTAKRMVAAMQLSIERFEKSFGPIETDVQKRVKGNP